jgi:peptidoglycan hydrolase-like protein with peptidoglycan-binding domain
MVMTRPAVTVLAVCLCTGLGWAAAPSSVKAKQAAAKARTATKKTSSKRVVAYRKPVPKKPSAPAAPGSERLRSVQQALIERGYLNSSASGVWNADSIEALKRFEADQKVKVDGKIDSKMLIALGLGPKYDNNLSLPVPSGNGGLVFAADQSSNNDPQRN